MTSNSKILTHKIDDDMVLYDPKADAVHTLNNTAQMIWENKMRPVEDIAHMLQKQYNVSYETALQDVTTTLQKLKTLGLSRESDTT